MPKPGLLLPSRAQPPSWHGEVWGERRGECGEWVWGSRVLFLFYFFIFFLVGIFWVVVIEREV